jgi:hypothetical protein
MRVQFELNDDAVKYLDQLQEDLHASSRGEVLRHAMAVLRWTTDKIRDGYQIRAMKEGDTVAKELSNPLLDQVAPRQVEMSARQREVTAQQRAAATAR